MPTHGQAPPPSFQVKKQQIQGQNNIHGLKQELHGLSLEHAPYEKPLFETKP